MVSGQTGWLLADAHQSTLEACSTLRLLRRDMLIIGQSILRYNGGQQAVPHDLSRHRIATIRLT